MKAFYQLTKGSTNNAFNADIEKRRAFAPLHFSAGYGLRWADWSHRYGYPL